MRERGEESETVLGLLDRASRARARSCSSKANRASGSRCCWPGLAKKQAIAAFSWLPQRPASYPAPLLAAVNAARATPGNGAGRRETTAPAPRADVVLAGLEELASAGPVLLTADDVQWADPATMQAFRSMPRLLASYPLSWILAMGTSADAGQAELLFDLLETTERPGSPWAAGSGGPGRPGRGRARRRPRPGADRPAATPPGTPWSWPKPSAGCATRTRSWSAAATPAWPPAQVSGAHVTSRIEALARHRLKGLSVRARRFVATALILGVRPGSRTWARCWANRRSPTGRAGRGAVRIPAHGEGGRPGLPA